jgi:hypothetical protein
MNSFFSTADQPTARLQWSTERGSRNPLAHHLTTLGERCSLLPKPRMRGLTPRIIRLRACQVRMRRPKGKRKSGACICRILRSMTKTPTGGF